MNEHTDAHKYIHTNIHTYIHRDIYTHAYIHTHTRKNGTLKLVSLGGEERFL